MMTDPLTSYDRKLWAGRFREYTDAMLLDRWRQASEEPSETDELCLAEIRKREMDL